ncbi:response regulator [Fluviispira vulneris]|uniref:response regulator n=1 Tax=Fluviispira vulneris TaxID=2763012 RepID=UPI001645C8C2|nr:response regulator [Fluviispira vulneris]
MSAKSVLIVDDAVETRLFLKGIIKSLGYTPIDAKSGIEALKILGDQKIDLVILDVLMPNFDGYQTLEFINQLKQTQNIKVIFFSGKKGELDQTKIDELKPDDFIHKTVDIQVLKTKIKKLVGGAEGQIPPLTPPQAPPAHAPAAAAKPTPAQAPAAAAKPTPAQAPAAAAKPTPAQAPAAAAKPTPAQAPAAVKQAHPGAPSAAAKPQAPIAAKQSPPAPSKLDLSATITNMPIVLDIKITQLSSSGIIFHSKFQFKEGAQLSINCPQASATLKKPGELQTKVHKCIQEGENYIVNTGFA